MDKTFLDNRTTFGKNLEPRKRGSRFLRTLDRGSRTRGFKEMNDRHSEGFFKDYLRKNRKRKPWSIPNIEGIDGETQNGRYVLLASSNRPPLYKSEGITANEFLDYLLEAPQGTIQVGYVTSYDITKGLL